MAWLRGQRDAAVSRWHPRRWSARATLVALTLVLTLGPLLGLGSIGSAWVRGALVEDMDRAMASMAHTTAGAIDRLNEDHIQLAVLLATTDARAALSDAPPDRERILDLLRAFLHSDPSFDGVTILDAAGRTVISTDERMYGKSYDFRPYVQHALAGRPNASPVSVSIDTLGPQIVYAAPISDTGRIIGVAAIRSNAAEVFRLIDADSNALGAATSGLLIDQNGIRLYDGANPDLQWKAIEQPPADVVDKILTEKQFGTDGGLAVVPAPELAEKLWSTRHGRTFTVVRDGAPWHMVAQPLVTQDWTYVVRVPESTLLAGGDTAVKGALLLIGLTALIVALVAFVLASSITQPIRRVVEDARRLAVGDIAESPAQRSVTSFGQDEVTQLQAAFAQVRTYLTQLAAVAIRVAQGDLSREAQPQSSGDTLGIAFQTMIGGLRVLDRQVSERTADLVRSNEELDASLRQLQVAQRRATFLAEANTELTRSLDYDRTLQAVAELSVPELADWCSVSLVDEDGTIRQVALVHSDPSQEAIAREMFQRYPRQIDDNTNPTSRVLSTGQPELLSVITADMLRYMSRTEEHFAYWSALAPRSSIVVPLVARGRILGALTLQQTRADRSVDESDLQLAEELARSAAQAVDNARLYSAAQREIAERRRIEQALEYQARHDGLTGLPNRTVLQDRLEQAISGPPDGAPGPSLLLMDLDGFKDVNDTLGHHAGDDLLQQVAARLRDAIRTSDSAARLGGDEFALLLPATPPDGALHVARTVLDVLHEPFTVDGQRVSIGASLGLASCPADGLDPMTLLRHADIAMYAAKQAHAGVVRYAPEQDRHTTGRLARAAELRDGLSRDELVLHYQPKVDLRTDRIVRVEALVRWQHPVHGLLSPDQFIPLAEQTGLIGPLGRWVIDAAVRQCSVWRADGLDLPVAVNVSVHDLRDSRLPQDITDVLTRYAVPASCLIVEITETGVLGDPARVLDVLHRLRRLGIQIAIDDFGAGNAALGYLKHLPVDELKIDRSFVQDMRHNSGDAAIVRATIDLAHHLGLSVVAEGVEDSDTCDVLAVLGCDLAQGYYISRPLDAASFGAWWRERAAVGGRPVTGILTDDRAA